jgi:hypothetical protein
MSSCGNSDSESPEEKSLISQLKGKWYAVDENEIFSFTFDENGKGSLRNFIYKMGTWSETESDFSYTLIEHKLTIISKSGDTIDMDIDKIVDGVAYLSKDGESDIMTKYDGSDQVINEQKIKVEESWVDTDIPAYPSKQFLSEEELMAEVELAYKEFKSFVFNQLNLEQIRLTKKDLSGESKSITPESSEIDATWKAAYQLINTTTNIIDNMDIPNRVKYLSYTDCMKYHSEAIALRDYVYYNMTRLWEHMPFIKTLAGNTKPEVCNHIEILRSIESELSGIDEVPGGENRLSKDVVDILRALIALNSGEQWYVHDYFLYTDVDFSLPISETEEPEMFKIFGSKLIIYTNEIKDLLLKESQYQYDTLVTNWQALPYKSGYWDLLLRMKKAQEVSGCSQFELLMPIPKDKVTSELKQNDGYNEN